MTQQNDQNEESKIKVDQVDKHEFASIPSTLPLLAVRDVVIFPGMVLPLSVGRQKSIRAIEEAMAGNKLIFLTAQKKMQTEDPSESDIYKIGVVSEILQMLKMPDGTLKVLVEGDRRAELVKFGNQSEKGYIEVEIKLIDDIHEESIEVEALQREIKSLFEKYVKLNRKLPVEIITAINNMEDIGKLTDMVSSHMNIKILERQLLLESASLRKRMEKLNELLTREIEILNVEQKIHTRVKDQIEKSQKEYYLNEQMKAIQKELKQKDDFGKEIDELRIKIKNAKMSKDAQEIADRELERLEKMMPFSPEATVIRTYLDWLVLLPWAIQTKDDFDIKKAENILNEDHFGLDKAKERVLEYLAVLKRVKKIKGPILCFVGPPGVGKTSLSRSIARALGRNFIRVSMGGVRDEAEIRGHRRTYIGALPGRVIQWMRKAKSNNPVFLLDEIDKMGTDWRGDPGAALLEVLDPEQNNTFVDHYLDVEFDLSNVMFVTTANTLHSIPVSLVDRLEVIRFPGYTINEKAKIAHDFLIPKQLKEHGLTDNDLVIAEDSVKEIVDIYTKEAGVRNLEREIASICRKTAKELAVEKDKKIVKISKDNVQKYLGVPEFFKDKVSPNEVGVATGLAWTEHGGETLTIEVSMLRGKGKFILTGKLGEVMQESCQAALSYIRTIYKNLGKGKDDFFKDKDFHIHVPEGAIPKDGPSAGIAISTALASAVSGKPIEKDLAMTGEVTLRGRVLTIGGLKEKVIAAFRDNIKTVLFPEGNKKDLQDIPEEIKKQIKLIPVKHMDEVLKYSLSKNIAKPATNGKRA